MRHTTKERLDLALHLQKVHEQERMRKIPLGLVLERKQRPMAQQILGDRIRGEKMRGLSCDLFKYAKVAFVQSRFSVAPTFV